MSVPLKVGLMITFSLKYYEKGAFNNYVDKMRGQILPILLSKRTNKRRAGEGVKNSQF